MDTTALVNFDIENGNRVIKILDDRGKSPQVALWAVMPEYEDWRLVLASAELNPGYSGYGELVAAMAEENNGWTGWTNKPTVVLRRLTDPFIQDLRKSFEGVTDTYGMRLGGQKFGNQFLEDAFVYRIR